MSPRLPILLLLIGSAVSATLPSRGLLPLYKHDGRIIGGNWIEIDDAPYMAAVIYYGGIYCGGTIISDEVILTAAHCVSGLTERVVRIRVGSTRRSAGGKLLNVRKLLAHENFNEVTYGSDVALIWLEAPLKFSNNIQQLTLPPTNAVYPTGTVGLVTGWGYINLSGLLPDHLVSLEVPILDHAICSHDYEGSIDDGMFCAGFQEGGKDACSGDSGGPVMFDNKVIGITSFGHLCALPNYPGIYTNVAYYGDWIREKLTENAYLTSA